jgi:hypothetical protein
MVVPRNGTIGGRAFVTRRAGCGAGACGRRIDAAGVGAAAGAGVLAGTVTGVAGMGASLMGASLIAHCV